MWKKFLPIILVIFLLTFFAWKLLPPKHAPYLKDPPLWQLAQKHGVDLGVYTALSMFNEPAYKSIAVRDFNLFVIDGEPNWHFEDGDLRPAKDKFDFSRIDKVLDFAQQNNKLTRAQHFVWGEEKWLPDWLKNGNFSHDELMQIVHDHIRSVGSNYSGKIKQWTVVNEAFTRGQHQNKLNDWWGDHIGPDYIEQSFIWAHEAAPDAKLVLNDFNSERINPVSDAMFRTVKDMKAKNIPIDAVGLQMHIDGSHPPTKDEAIANMKRFGDIGVKVFVTEFDVNMNDATGTKEDKEKKQADIYYDMMRACIESKVCPSFSILGITDKDSWYNKLGVPDAMPLPFDKYYQPKPAYFALRRALQQD